MLTEGDHDVHQSNQETKTVSVVGFGGLGKTTLVKAVYEKLTLNFPFKAFVPVGQNLDLNKVLKDILIALDKDRLMTGFNFTILDDRQLIEELREFLKDKRYFIVIDDVWDVTSWQALRHALVDNSLESKIVITTRKHDVAKEADCPYSMEPLRNESSKILFYGRIFSSEGECPSHLSDVSEKILKKCGGVPLAIITTSGLLANKSRNIKVWNEVCDSIGSGLGSNHNMENMRKILSLSYYDLPCYLKTCLLYLSIFPEDNEIGRERVILRWIAEDFVEHGEECQSLFELGESYFSELIDRSLIQVADTYVDGTPQSCRVHDMVLELICSLSRKENFVTTVQGDSRQSTPSSGSVRRLSLQNTAWPTMEIAIPFMLSSSTVLDLEGCNLEDHPSLKFVGNLLHLSYLSLARTGYGSGLPAEMGKLQFLQTLDLFMTPIDELPSIAGLRQLIFLCIPSSTRPPSGLRCLKYLEDLGEVRLDSACMAEELGHLTGLRRLCVWLRKEKDGICDENMCTALVRSLAKLHKIQKLMVSTSYGIAADLEGSVESLGNLTSLLIDTATSLPTWICPASLLLLSHLHITLVQVRMADIRVLGMLQVLCLLQVRVSGEIQVLDKFIVSHDAFQCVIKCEFYGFSMAPSAFQPGAMPRLKVFTFSIRLEDFAGGKFTGDDLAFGHLPSLQSVRVGFIRKQDVSEEVVIEVEEKLRREMAVHPNNPYIDVSK
ncbi:unnamed protein product [Urochloa decumbens]|uniref:NB-ARC domain-containing protein n=1 Tax=Urochloa decumbens TaxID=240449 RepID=A0ABC9B1G8_9POAL